MKLARCILLALLVAGGRSNAQVADRACSRDGRYFPLMLPLTQTICVPAATY